MRNLSFNPFKKVFEEAIRKSPELEKKIREKEKNELLEKIKDAQTFSSFLVCLDEAKRLGYIREATSQERKEIRNKLAELKRKIKEAKTLEEKIYFSRAFYSLLRRTLEVKRKKDSFLYVEKEFVRPSKVKEERPRKKEREQKGLKILRELAKLRERIGNKNKNKSKSKAS